MSALKDTIKGYDPNSADIHVNVYGICSMRFVEPIKCLSSVGYTINPDFVLSIAIKDKNYKLFNFIQKQESYDEDEVKNHFKNEVFVQHFASEKNQLLHHILKEAKKKVIFYLELQQ